MSTEPAAASPRPRARRVGRVTSLAGAKSVVVQVDRQVMDARYGKFIRRRAKFMAHDERGTCGLGDVVEIASTRPLSARKRWRVTRVVRRGVAPEAAAGQAGEEAGAS